jgi:hypothetical protein
MNDIDIILWLMTVFVITSILWLIFVYSVTVRVYDISEETLLHVRRIDKITSKKKGG